MSAGHIALHYTHGRCCQVDMSACIRAASACTNWYCDPDVMDANLVDLPHNISARKDIHLLRLTRGP